MCDGCFSPAVHSVHSLLAGAADCEEVSDLYSTSTHNGTVVTYRGEWSYCISDSLLHTDALLQ
jgi:hypothetical protein